MVVVVVVVDFRGCGFSVVRQPRLDIFSLHLKMNVKREDAVIIILPK